jgi:hypothetical protein
VNVQNIPRKDKVIKAAFCPKLDAFVVCDFPNIEAKFLAYFLEAIDFPEMAEAFRNGLDLHKLTAAGVYGIAQEDVSDEQRQVGKVMNFSIIYGGGIRTLINQGVAKDAKGALGLLRKYHEAWPGIGWESKRQPANEGTFIWWIKKRMRERGYITTPWGRHLHPQEMHAALNHLCQGSAADLMKWALIPVSENTQHTIFRSEADARGMTNPTKYRFEGFYRGTAAEPYVIDLDVERMAGSDPGPNSGGFFVFRETDPDWFYQLNFNETTTTITYKKDGVYSKPVATTSRAFLRDENEFRVRLVLADNRFTVYDRDLSLIDPILVWEDPDHLYPVGYNTSYYARPGSLWCWTRVHARSCCDTSVCALGSPRHRRRRGLRGRDKERPRDGRPDSERALRRHLRQLPLRHPRLRVVEHRRGRPDGQPRVRVPHDGG